MAASAKPQKDLVAVQRQPAVRLMFELPHAMTNKHRQILMDYWDHDLSYPPKEKIWFERCPEVMEVLEYYRLLPGEQA